MREYVLGTARGGGECLCWALNGNCMLLWPTLHSMLTSSCFRCVVKDALVGGAGPTLCGVKTLQTQCE
jgi:hypothetical protein